MSNSYQLLIFFDNRKIRRNGTNYCNSTFNVLLVALSLFISGQTQWLDIPHHDKQIYFSEEETVSNFDEAKIKCNKLNAIPLVLWEIPVLEFVGIFIINNG